MAVPSADVPSADVPPADDLPTDAPSTVAPPADALPTRDIMAQLRERKPMNDKPELNVSWRTYIRLVITVMVIFLCIRYWGAVENFVVLFFGGALAIFAGLIISYIVNIPLRFFEEKLPGPTGDGTRNRLFAIVLSVVCVVAVLLLVSILVVPSLVEAIVTLAHEAPYVVDSFVHNKVVVAIVPAQILESIAQIDWQNLIGEAASWLQSGMVSSLPRITSLLGQIGAWFMGIILGLWFVSEKDKLSAGVHKLIRTYIGKRADENFSRAINVADESFSGYFVGQSLEAIVFGSLVGVACTIARMPDALMLGVLIGVMSLIPMVGALIGAALGAVIILASSWQKALLFVVVFFVVQQIEANVFYPRVVGRQVGLTGMWPLIGITLGVAVFGFVGAFIGVPLIATIFRIVSADLKRREQLPGDSITPLEKLHQSLSSKE
jgi:predicted PurR-regulated permease PerM